ncbi:A/G-specific adenine glycosylase [bacterium]|nr:A/G-specific adenine glycosylase [bacterium]
MKVISSNAEIFLGHWPELKQWFRKGARALPWRKGKVDPYGVWISEMMSQQSVMKTVIPYYERWMKTFPTLSSLAKASEEDVLKLWAGLGYYSRARNILKTAKILSELPAWPQTEDEMRALPGVGPYTAAAVLSIGLGKKALAVDGNVLRVGARFFGIKDPLNNSKDRSKIEELFRETLSGIRPQDASIFTQSLMELGALVCKPKASALCELCPLSKSCVALQKKKVALWPLAKKRREVIEVFQAAELNPSHVRVVQIPKGQRLQGQWELPLKDLSPREFHQILNKNKDLSVVNHSITHHKYRVIVLPTAKLGSKRGRGNGKSFKATQAEGSGLHLTTLTQKILKTLK